jgi:hypothetical protein
MKSTIQESTIQKSNSGSRLRELQFLVLITFVLTCAALTQSAAFQLRFDVSFAQKGMLALDTAQERLEIIDLQTLSNGGIMVLANPRDENKPALVMKQFLANGMPDAKFGSNGIVRLPGANASSMARFGNGDWLILRDGNILQRLSSTGKPVLRFGQKGVLRIPTPKGYGFEAAFVNPETSSITLGGTYNAPPNKERLVMPALASARLTGEGKLDATYGFSGVNRTALDMVGGFRNATLIDEASISVFGYRPPGTAFGASQIHEARFDAQGGLERVQYFTSSFYGSSMVTSRYGMVFASNFDFDSTDSFVIGGHDQDSQRFETKQWPAMSELRSEDNGDVVFGVQSLVNLEESMLVFGRIKGREKPVVLHVIKGTELTADLSFGQGGVFELPQVGDIALTRAFEGGLYVATSSEKGPLNLWRLRF